MNFHQIDGGDICQVTVESIPLEALRLGCDAFASDLNPVACLILKVMLEDIPRRGPGLADELRRVGGEIKTAAQEELADLYPPDPDGARPIAYLWARTVSCESPNCGAEIPLMRSFWLCRKRTRKWALRPRVVRAGNDGPPRVEFEIFQPATEKEAPAGTVARAKTTCLCCQSVLSPDRVKTQLSAQRGGADAVFDEAGDRVGGARMTAVVTVRPAEKGRFYRLPNEDDYAAVRRAQELVAGSLREWERDGRQDLCPVPDEPLPPIGTLSMLRKCFLDGSLTRLIDPDAVVRSRVVEWVENGEFGLGSGGGGEGLLYAPERVWFREPVPPEEVMLDPDVCLLKRKVAERLKAATDGAAADALARDLRRALEDLDLADHVRIESEPE